MASGSEVPIDFCTLGMFIIDEIHFPPPTPPVQDILGGAGSYCALGARIFSPPPLSKSVGWLIDCGSDFPPQLRESIAQWTTSCLIRETPERLTTRGWNEYGENEHRAFRYLTPKLRLDANSLTAPLLGSKSFHLICSPTRCIDMATGIITRRDKELKALHLPSPTFVWEPVPDLCTPSELESCYDALKLVQIVSPNHEELASFFGLSGHRGEKVDRDAIESCATDWLSSGIGIHGSGAVVVRAGKEGCYVATRTGSKWIPAYHQSGDRVADPTGGGNTFLGGLAVGLARGKSVDEAAIWGSIAASFAIEQVGMATLTDHPDGERWNGEKVTDRLGRFVDRLK